MAKHPKISIDGWIDRFVEHINRSSREPKFAKDLPAWLRVGPHDPDMIEDAYTGYTWRIQKAEQTPWIDTLESKLPFPFPPSFRSLIARYVYPDFTIAPLFLFANTGESLHYEMSGAILRDAHLSKILVKHGYLHFARPDTGDYDPICFDTKQRLKGGEYPVVRVDHEAILCDHRIGSVTPIAPSFLAFVTEVVQRAETSDSD